MNPILHTILQKAILTVNPFEKEKILQKWITIKYDKGFDYETFWKIFTGFVIIFLIILFVVILYWNRKLKTLNAQLKKLSQTDALTSLYNRVKLDEIFSQELLRSQRYKTPLSIIMIDLDFFKAINDTYGHNVGDTVLKRFATLLKKGTRETDFVGRWGGEEFIILCTNTNLEGAIKVSNTLQESIKELDLNIQRPLTASFGVTQYVEDQSLASFIKNADDALYDAKNSGRNCIKFR